MPEYRNNRTGQTVNVPLGQPMPNTGGNWQPSIGNSVPSGQYAPTVMLGGAQPSPNIFGGFQPPQQPAASYASPIPYGRPGPHDKIIPAFFGIIILGAVLLFYYAKHAATVENHRIALANAERNRQYAEFAAQQARWNKKHAKYLHEIWVRGQENRKRMLADFPGIVLGPNQPDPLLAK